MRHVVAMGSGGFLGSPRATPLDHFVLSLADRSTPKVCFVATAVGDSGERIAHFYEVLGRERCEPTHLPLFSRDGTPLDDLIADQDVIYVAGGNTANLLAIWRLHGFDRALAARADQRDLVVCGPSAGGLCWFECGVTDSFTLDLGPLDDGMGWVRGSFCPHYDEEARRKPVYRELVRRGRLPAGIAADGGAAAYFVDGDLREVVTERSGASAYRVEARGSEVVEERLEARALTQSVD